MPPTLLKGPRERRKLSSLQSLVGVSEQALRGWMKRGELTTAEREELRRLRRQVKTLQEEHK